jgi:hypothetical protein
MTAAPDTLDALAITEPGVYDLPFLAYLADPVAGGSLSSTGARRLLDCPAKYRWQADHPQPPKREFDLGHAAHKYVLGAGAELVVLDYPNYLTKKAKSERDAAYDAGKTPLLTHHHEQVLAMAAELRKVEAADGLFKPGTGTPEQTLVWQDRETGVWCRALLDWLPHPTDSRFLLRDYKTSGHGANPDGFDRTVYNFGYHIQLAFHLMGARALGLAGDDAQALLVVQETDPPYLAAVINLDRIAMRIGHQEARRAIHLYAECQAAGRWPGYADEVHVVGLPIYAERRYAEELTR